MSLRPFFDNAPNTKLSRAQEQREARRRGGRRQPGSGNKPGRRGDVSVKLGADAFLGELKFTTAASHDVKLALMKKIEREAVEAGKKPYYMIEFRDEGASREGEQYFVIPRWVLEEMVDGVGLAPATA